MKSGQGRIWGALLPCIGVACFAAAVIAGCGGDDSSGTTTTDGGSDAVAADTGSQTTDSGGGIVDAAACTGASTLCSGTCVSTASDLANCGSCGNACKTGEVCSKGTCALTCGGGTTQCGATCFDLKSDPGHCGACGTACGQGQACNNGTCALACAPGLTKCGGADSGADSGATYCANVQVDANNCGTCGTTCGAGQSCSAGKCQQGCVSSAGCPTTAAVCTANACAVPKDCSEIRAARPSAPSGTYTIDPDGAGGVAAFTAYCDMTTYGGGWTIVTGITGADNEQPLVSDTEVAGNPLSGESYNVNRAKKMALSALETESIFVRPGGVWLRADKPLFDANLATANQESAGAVKLMANDGTAADGFMGYTNYNDVGGGDFGVSMNPDFVTPGGTTVNGFDRHSTSYYHLNYGCQGQYLYSYSNVDQDSDPGYDVNTGLGSWAATNGCDGNEGGALQFYAAMRRNLAAGTTCKAIYDAASGNIVPDGQYIVDPDGAGGNDPYVAYCDMTHGGYTLLVGANGSSTTFGNNGTAWMNGDSVGGAPNLSGVDYKSPAYGSLATNAIRLCYKDTAHCHTFNHAMNSTLLNFFTSNTSYVEYANDMWGYTNAGADSSRTTYEGELGVPADTASCYWLGINHKETDPAGTTTQGFSAIGLMGDNNCGCQSYFDANNCGTNNWSDDFAIGVGLQSCVDASGCGYGGSSNLAGTTEAGGVANPTGPWFVFGR